jgi:hypothetical protein
MFTGFNQSEFNQTPPGPAVNQAWQLQASALIVLSASPTPALLMATGFATDFLTYGRSGLLVAAQVAFAIFLALVLNDQMVNREALAGRTVWPSLLIRALFPISATTLAMGALVNHLFPAEISAAVAARIASAGAEDGTGERLLSVVTVVFQIPMLLMSVIAANVVVTWFELLGVMRGYGLAKSDPDIFYRKSQYRCAEIWARHQIWKAKTDVLAARTLDTHLETLIRSETLKDNDKHKEEELAK